MTTKPVLIASAFIATAVVLAVSAWLFMTRDVIPHWMAYRVAARYRSEFIRLTKPILEESDECERYSLDGDDAFDVARAPTDRFGAWPSYGKITITDPHQRAVLIEALYASVDTDPVDISACFTPHHGIRARAGGHEVDQVICFSCRRIEGTFDGKRISAQNDGKPLVLFNQVLHAGGVRLAPGMSSQ